MKTGIQTGLDPQSEALRFRLRMTRGVSFPRKRESSLFIWILHQVQDDKECVIPVKTGIQAGLDPQSEALCFRLRMTRGVSFPPPFRHSRENGNPVRIGSRIKCGMTGGAGSPIQSASLSVEDDKGCVIPAPLPSFPRKRESSQDWIPHQVRDDGRCWIPNPKRFAFG